MASYGLLSCGRGSFGRLLYIYSESFLALKTLSVLIDILMTVCKAQMACKESRISEASGGGGMTNSLMPRACRGSLGHLLLSALEGYLSF